MASDDSSGVRPVPPIVLRIKLRYDDVEVMVQRFATNVGKSGLFLPTKSLQPIGAEIKFELRLADDTPVLVGLGRVKLAQPPEPNNPKATFGMAIELMRVTPQSRALILRMLERRRELGLPELGLPTPADIDAARRAEAVNAPVRDAETAPVPVPVPSTQSTVPSPPLPSEVPMSPVPSEAALPPASGEVLRTSPRRSTGPMAVAKVLAVTPLAAEPPRRKRLAVSEVIENASGPVASVAVAVPVLDDDVDLAAAIVRARALAGGALDAELAALGEVAATTLEISIEAASAALARQFGGSAVLRDRNARWAPPAVPASPVASPSGVEDVARQAPEPAPEPAQAFELARKPEPPPEPGLELASPAAGSRPSAPSIEPAAVAPADHDDEARDVRSFAPLNDQIATEPNRRQSRQRMARSSLGRNARDRALPEHHEVEPDQIADEIHQLSELDLEDVEHTEMADIPLGPGAFELRGDGRDRSAGGQARLEARLEAQLAEAEAEADADDLGIRSEGSRGDPGAAPPDVSEGSRRDPGAARPDVSEGSRGDPGAARPDVSESSRGDPGAAPLDVSEGSRRDPGAAPPDVWIAGAVGIPASRESSTAFGAPPDADVEPRDDQAAEPPVEVEEIEDFEILAEADADDADLLLAHGEQEASRQLVLADRPPTAPRRASELDFAARLDLDEESDMYFAVSGSEFAAAAGRDAAQEEFADRHAHDGLHGIFDGDSRLPDPHPGSAGHALAAFETGDESIDQSLDPDGLAPTRGVQPIFDPEGSNSYTLAIVPSDSDELDFPPPGRPQPVDRSPKHPPAGRPPEPVMLRGSPGSGRAPVPRATTDDGLVIEIDEDDDR